MSDLDLQNDERLDAAMRLHLSAQLDPQRGRAVAAFRRHVHTGTASAAVPMHYEIKPSAGDSSRNPWWWRRGPWALAMVGSAMAASLLTLLAAPVMWRNHLAATPGAVEHSDPFSGQSIQPTPVTHMDETVRSQLYDGGMIIMPDGTPVRRLRRLNIHERLWQNDATGERVQQVVPSEDLMLYEMKTY